MGANGLRRSVAGAVQIRSRLGRGRTRRLAERSHIVNMERDEATHARRQAIIDRMLSEALEPPGRLALPSHESLPADIRRTIERLVAKADAERRNVVTYEDLEEALPPRDITAEDLEAIFWVLSKYGIEVADE